MHHSGAKRAAGSRVHVPRVPGAARHEQFAGWVERSDTHRAVTHCGKLMGFRYRSTHPCNSEIDYDWPVPKRNGLPRRAFRGRPLAIGSNPS
jgi:hypothetical protein